MDLGVTKCFSVSTKFVRISATFWKKSIFHYATYDRWKKDWFEKDCGMKRCAKTLVLNWKWIEKMRIPFNANNLSNSLSNADSSFGCLQIGNDEREKCCLTRRKTVDKLSSSFFFLSNEGRSHWLSEWKETGNFDEKFSPYFSTVLSHVRLKASPPPPRLRVQRRGYAAFSHLRSTPFIPPRLLSPTWKLPR